MIAPGAAPSSTAGGVSGAEDASDWVSGAEEESPGPAGAGWGSCGAAGGWLEASGRSCASPPEGATMRTSSTRTPCASSTTAERPTNASRKGKVSAYHVSMSRVNVPLLSASAEKAGNRARSRFSTAERSGLGPSSEPRKKASSAPQSTAMLIQLSLCSRSGSMRWRMSA